MVGLMATILITGVSGVLGSRLLPFIAARPEIDKVIGVDTRPLSITAPKLEFVQADLSTADLSPVFERTDTLVHLAMSPQLAVIRSLLDACTQFGVRHVVTVSSAAVYGAWQTNAVPLTEDAPLRPNPGFDYAVRMAERERLLADWRASHDGSTLAVLRLAMMLGGGLEKALSAALGGVSTHPHMNATRPVQFLHVDDAVTAILLATVKHLDDTYNVAPNGLVGDAKARAVAGAIPRPALPRRIAYVANDLIWRRHYSAAFAAAQPYLEHPWVISNDRLQAEGWRPTYTNEEALVAESHPTWWGNLAPGRRRSIVTGAIVGGSAASAGVAIAAAIAVGRKHHNRR